MPMVVLFLLPVAASIGLILPLFGDFNSFSAMLAHPQFWGGLWLTLWIGLCSTAVSVLCALRIVYRPPRVLNRDAGIFLAVPHIALALGLAFMLAPTGLVARFIANAITGWTAPPQWVAVQDPFGMSLIAALVLKETPFVVWALLSVLNRADVKQNLAQQSRIARSLGHGPGSVWLRIVLPQIVPRIVWPVVAVFTYGMTIVDMALIIGPTQPPTLATIIWRDLNDGETWANARGAAGVLLLSFAIFVIIAISALLIKFTKLLRHRFYAFHPGPEYSRASKTQIIWLGFTLFYGLLAVILALQSISGHWPFPNLLTEQFTLKAWSTLLTQNGPLLTTIFHATTSSVAALLLSVMWLESQPSRRDYIVLWACGLSLCLPALLLGLGQYRLFLMLGNTGSHTALFLAHLLPTTAYVFIMVHGPYRSFDPRWSMASNGLSVERMRFLLRIKWPLLKTALWSSLAVGFAVATAQFVGVQLAASGRHATLAMEAVTLSSGGNRPLIATYALALMLLPFIGFTFAAAMGRPRQGTT